jgi:hypothetical protein
VPNKYIVHGAAYCGKGDGPLIPTSISHQDATGYAWNNINILTGTAPAYGTLSAGDTVYIRSKSEANADISISYESANVTLGSSNATTNNPIKWIWDGGTVWSGVQGTLTFTATANDTYDVIIAAYNSVKAAVQDKIVVVAGNSAVDSVVFTMNTESEADGFLFDFDNNTADDGAKIAFLNGCVLRNPHVLLNTCSATIGGGSPIEGANVLIINPQIEIVSGAVNVNGILSPGRRGGTVTVLGGSVSIAGDPGNYPLLSSLFAEPLLGHVDFFGLDIPKTMKLWHSYGTARAQPATVRFLGQDGGAGSAILAGWGTLDSRDDGNYPTLNAVLPDSNGTPWSYKLYAYGATAGFPARFFLGAKLYTQTAASKTITVELQVSEDFGTLQKDRCAIEVIYVDSTGVTRVESSAVSPDALDSSASAWSSDSYGITSLLAKKIALTTQHSIKKDTLVMVYFSWGVPCATASQIAFICPSVELS